MSHHNSKHLLAVIIWGEKGLQNLLGATTVNTESKNRSFKNLAVVMSKI